MCLPAFAGSGRPDPRPELVARVHGLIRRAGGQASPVLRCGDLALDTRSGRLTLGGQAVTLTSHEHKVLDCLMHRPARWSRTRS